MVGGHLEWGSTRLGSDRVILSLRGTPDVFREGKLALGNSWRS